MRHPHRPGALVTVVALALGAAACAENSATLITPESALRPRTSAALRLDSRRAPSSLELGFALSPDGSDWSGTVYVGDRACGSMHLLAAAPRRTGAANHVRYTLMISGDNPDFQLGADLAGVVVRNRVVLNGRVNTGFYTGQTIHPRGRISGSDGGSVDDLTTLTGTVKLNPQPEPPSAAFPPSPCVR